MAGSKAMRRANLSGIKIILLKQVLLTIRTVTRLLSHSGNYFEYPDNHIKINHKVVKTPSEKNDMQLYLRELFYRNVNMSIIGDWNDTERMQKNFGDHLIRERLGELIDAAERRDRQAYEKMNLLYNRM